MNVTDTGRRIKILLCDESAFLRVKLRHLIDAVPDLEVTDIARNGLEAIEKSKLLQPDVILLSIKMHCIDGLTVLKEIVKLKIAPVIMLVMVTLSEAPSVMEAVEAGAFDFIAKPSNIDHLDTQASLIIQKIKHAHASNLYRKIQPHETSVTPSSVTVPFTGKVEGTLVENGICSKNEARDDSSDGPPQFKAVALGLSTGGPKSIFSILPELPADLNAAVLVVQHMPPSFIPAFVERINKKTAMECVKTESGMVVSPGKIYIARGGFHLKLVKRRDGEIIIRQVKEPSHLYIPSVDIMMHSVCDIFGAQTIGVLMTGMGRDGAEGMHRIHRAGGLTIAESEETSIVFGMPQEAIKRGAAQYILPNWAIPQHIIKAAGKSSIQPILNMNAPLNNLPSSTNEQNE